MFVKYRSEFYSSPESWDIVVLSFKQLFTRIQFWIRPNILSVLFSALIVTAPGGTAALYHTVSLGLYDPAGSSVRVWEEMKNGFSRNVLKAIALFLLKITSLLIIILGIIFWVSQEQVILRFVSIIAFYGLVMWWLSIGYLYPILITEKDLNVFGVAHKALKIAFRYPFDSLLFAVVSSLLFLLGMVLLGPIILIIPATRAVLHLNGYWLLSGYIVPGLISIEEFSKMKYKEILEGN